MDKEILDEKVTALRGERRNGRTSKASRAAEEHGPDHDRSTGTAFQDARREIEVLDGNTAGPKPNNGSTGSDQRGADKVPGRSGSTGGRSGESNSVNVATPAETGPGRRAIGALETDSPIPIRKLDPDKPDATFQLEEKRPVGRPPKPKEAQDAAAPKKKLVTWFKGQVISAKDAQEMLEPLSVAMIDDCGYIDKAIWGYTQDKDQTQVWSDISEKEADALAKLMLRRAQHSPAAATVVRGILEAQDYVDAGMIVLPRIVLTRNALKNAPKRERVSRPVRVARMKEAQRDSEN